MLVSSRPRSKPFMGWRKRHDYGEEILQVFQEIGEIVMIRA